MYYLLRIEFLRFYLFFANYLYGKSLKKTAVTSTFGTRYIYKITPAFKDQGILCICRRALYLVSVSQTNNAYFNNCGLATIYKGSGISAATVKIDSDNKIILFECDVYENPVFIGLF